jgi:hypothetical protein
MKCGFAAELDKIVGGIVGFCKGCNKEQKTAAIESTCSMSGRLVIASFLHPRLFCKPETRRARAASIFQRLRSKIVHHFLFAAKSFLYSAPLPTM